MNVLQGLKRAFGARKAKVLASKMDDNPELGNHDTVAAFVLFHLADEGREYWLNIARIEAVTRKRIGVEYSNFWIECSK